LELNDYFEDAFVRDKISGENLKDLDKFKLDNMGIEDEVFQNELFMKVKALFDNYKEFLEDKGELFEI
jgi:hypothetical protein